MTKANDSASTPSSEQQSVGNGAFRVQIRSFLLSNLTAVVGTFWSVCLFVGGLFFLIYFASIGFMPEFDLQTSIGLLVVSALTGGFHLIILSFFLLAPGLWWIYMTRNQELLQSPRWFILPMFGIILSFFLTILIPTTLWFHFVIGITIVIATLLILSGKQLLNRFWLSGKQLLKRPWFTSGQLLKMLWFSLSGKQLLNRFWLSSKQLLNGILTRCVQIALQRWITVYFFSTTFILVSAYMLIGILIIIGLIGEDKELRKDATNALIVPLLLVFLNNILIVTKRSFTILWQVIAIFFVIFLNLNVWTFIPRRIISIYKFGNLENASVVLNEIGCAIAKNHGLKVTPYTPDPKIVTTSDPKSCSLSNVIIHSRLGNTYYLETSRSNDTAIHFTIPGQNVLSWAVDESKKATTAGAPASTQNPAPTTEIAPPNKGMEPTR